MTVEKPKPKQLLRPITTRTNSAMNQSQFLAITCNSLEAREKSRLHGAIGFGFASHWLKNWSDSFKPITKRSNRNHAIAFDSLFTLTENNFGESKLSCTRVNFGEILFAGTKRAVPGGQCRSILSARVANQNTEFAAYCRLAELAI